MKQLSKYLCVLALITAPLLAQGSRKSIVLEECSQVIAFADITPEISRQLSYGELPNVAIEVKEGSEFPAALFTKFAFFSVEQNPSFKVNVDRTCYFRFVSDGQDKIRACISFDLVNWKKSRAEDKGVTLLNINANAVQVIVDPSAEVED